MPHRIIQSFTPFVRCPPSGIAKSSGAHGRRHLATREHNTADPFKVLFFGRDEFSCIVLEHLQSARGVYIESVIRAKEGVKCYTCQMSGHP